MYEVGDFIETNSGMLIVQCPIKFEKNNNSSYEKVSGRILYWLFNENYEDVLLWDAELYKILTKSEKFLLKNKRI